MVYRALVDAVVVAHAAYLTYLALGGLLAWRLPRTLALHLAAVGWGILVVALPVDCPLTALENWLRRQGGEPTLASGFIDHYVEGVAYPASYTTQLRWLVAFVVVVSWVGLALRRKTWSAHADLPQPR